MLYNRLNREIKFLGRNYLNYKPRLNGDYTNKQLSAAAAYTVFCHAEIEDYLESWARKILDIARENWRKKRSSRALVHLCTFHEGRGELTSQPKSDIWSEIVVRCMKKHDSVITNNNGIKEAHVCKLLSPLGFDVRKIDGVLLADLDAFGSIRGDYAHRSHRDQLRQRFDPFDVRQKAESLVTSIAPLELELDAYAKIART